jgi:hypothetical protein
MEYVHPESDTKDSVEVVDDEDHKKDDEDEDDDEQYD